MTNLNDYMMYCLFGDTRKKEFLREMKRLNIGRMCIRDKPDPYPDEKWGFDNGAFSYWINGKQFNRDEYLKRFEKAYKIKTKPYIAVLPDIVAGGKWSLEFSLNWLELLPGDWNWYLSIQDGMSFISVEESLEDKRIKGIFLGGTNNFKGRQGLIFRQLAQKLNIKFHFGRAGTFKRIEFAKEIKSDSFDSSFPLWTNERFYRMIKFIEDGFQQNQINLALK